MTRKSAPHVEEVKREFSLAAKIINGAIAGIVGVTCVFPLDMVKTRLQSEQIGPHGEKMYKNVLDCFRKTYRAEGFFGMYRGSAVNILLITPEKAIKLASNDFFRHHFTTEDGKLPVTRQMAAGGLAGLCQISVTTPMEFLKIQMQNAGRNVTQAKLEGKDFTQPSAAKIALQVVKEKGIFGLYRGFAACMLRDVTFSMWFFPVFAALNDLGPKKNDDEPVFWCTLLAGLGAGASAAWLDTPFDVTKTRLQNMRTIEGEKEFNGIIDCIRKTIKYEGLRSMFKGGLCRVMVIAPLFGIAQMVYFFGVGEYLLSVK